ncbi:MAG: phosphotransferase [Xanthomonadales bacterium]|nr:phosphotransferase [Xanthomonadales bacterium]
MSDAAGNHRETSDSRKARAAAWAADRLGLESIPLEPVSGDASFRRYFRTAAGRTSLILMDAPPDQEDSRPFLDVAARLREAGLKAPEILHFDLSLGFGLIEDFGDTLYRELISPESIDDLVPDLFGALEGMAHRVQTWDLPAYDGERLQEEMDLFRDWYLDRHRGRPLRADEEAAWQTSCDSLIDSARRQPQVFVHKDFHSCNLLRTPQGPGIIDFQDGLVGPLSYDFVSLVWDRYIAWPRPRLEQWMGDMHRRLRPGCPAAEWVRCCDLMGLQRNLKIVGIFARLHYRDGKAGYLELIPRFYDYLLDVLPRYPEFRDLQRLLETPECAP